MDKHTKGWKRAKEMRKWRDHKGGLKVRKPREYLKTALGEAMEDWLNDQRRSGLRFASIEGRRIHIRLFLQWCWNCNVTRPEWISRGLLEAWLAWVDDYRTRKGTQYADTSKESHDPLRVRLPLLSAPAPPHRFKSAGWHTPPAMPWAQHSDDPRRVSGSPDAGIARYRRSAGT
jgi:hypothetical protein